MKWGAAAVLAALAAGVSCSGTSEHHAAWGLLVEQSTLGKTAPKLTLETESDLLPTVIKTDWNGTNVQVPTIDWKDAPVVSRKSLRRLRVHANSRSAPMTARLKAFSQVDPTTGVPTSAPILDIECPAKSTECDLVRAGTGYAVTFNTGELRGAQYVVVSFRWGFQPKVEPGQTVSHVDNVWSVAVIARIADRP